MLSLKLAFRNLIGAGLRTWLNVAVLSFAFVVIVLYNGILDGWNRQAHTDTIAWETGQGELWNPKYDPYDPFSLQDAHDVISGKLQKLVNEHQLTPILVTQATIYPQGRMENVYLKGIDPNQNIIKLPSYSLNTNDNEVPALIGKRLAESAKLKKGDMVMMRWRDKNGTFDAMEVRIVNIFYCNVPSIDNGQIWIPLQRLQKMTVMTGEATYFISGNAQIDKNIDNWQFKDLKFLLSDIDNVIQAKKGAAAVIYFLLLTIALLAIFDTQVLSIFRRQREIGTYIALGMTRSQVVRLFTIEGSAHSILAIILGALYGVPLLLFIQKTGISMPKSVGDMGMTMAEKLFPYYSAGLFISVILLVIISSTIVSYFPTRRISKLNPGDALKGKLQ